MTDLVERSVGPDDVSQGPQAPVRRPAAPRVRPEVPAAFIASVRSALEQRRLFNLLPFAMAIGVVANAALDADPPLALLGATALALVLAAILARQSLGALRLILLAASALAGVGLVPLHGALFGTQMLARPVYGTLTAAVDDLLDARGGETRVVVSGLIWEGGDKTPGIRRVRLVIKGGPSIAPGDVISGPVRLAPVPGAAYPGGFDAQFQAFFDGIGAYGTTTRPPVITPGGGGVAATIAAVRHEIAARIDAVLPEPSAGVARAIINGDQSAVPDTVRDMMATAGIAHVLSVSGLHLTIVAGGVFWIVRLLLAGFEGLARWVSIKRLAAVAGMASAVAYYGISGGNVAALRSTLMILLVFGAVLFGRRALTMRNVAIAGLLIIATDPASVVRPSFQLSFAAVIGLIGAYETLARDGSEARGLLGHGWAYVKGIVITSLVAGFSTLLFSVYHFQQTSPLGVVGNLVTLPLVGFIMMPAAAVAVLAMPLGIEAPFLRAMGWSVDRMLDLAAIVAEWSTHLRAAPLLSGTALLIGLLALGWFAFFRDRWRLLGPALAIPAVLLFGLDVPPDVLIADSTQTVAVREADGLALADGKSKSFVLDVWRETYSEPITQQAALTCDAQACVGTGASGFRYALVLSSEALAEECEAADLLIVRFPAPGWCRAPAVIDSRALRNGVHWLRWDSAVHRFEIRRATALSDRPWRPALRP